MLRHIVIPTNKLSYECIPSYRHCPFRCATPLSPSLVSFHFGLEAASASSKRLAGSLRYYLRVSRDICPLNFKPTQTGTTCYHLFCACCLHLQVSHTILRGSPGEVSMLFYRLVETHPFLSFKPGICTIVHSCINCFHTNFKWSLGNTAWKIS